jgi:hypothetical protein
MLILPLKPAVRYDIFNALAKWLDSDHHISFELKNPLQFILPKPEFCSVACRDELMRLQGLRNSLSDTLLKASSHKSAMEEGAFEDLHEYHAVLLEFEKRGFPTVDDELTGIQLTWKGAWAPRQETHATLLWDRANTIFNSVALLTAKAADANPTDRISCKQAVSDCQSAASLLALLKQIVQPEDFASVEFSNALLHFWERFLLAQAQTFIYRMASLSPAGANHTTLSVLAQASFELFNQALNASQDPRLLSEVPKQAQEEWAPYCKTNSMLAGARAEYHDAVVHRLAHAWGKELARLRSCETKLQACHDFCRTVDTDGESCVAYNKRECNAILPVVRDRLVEADQDNYNIYQEEIPKQMPDITAKQLAKISELLPETMLIPKKALFVNL